tara:strand:+ start:4573 stop:4932 length:360 start_codon:yes stop_codon:yes gene_type:complete
MVKVAIPLLCAMLVSCAKSEEPPTEPGFYCQAIIRDSDDPPEGQFDWWVNCYRKESTCYPPTASDNVWSECQHRSAAWCYGSDAKPGCTLSFDGCEDRRREWNEDNKDSLVEEKCRLVY